MFRLTLAHHLPATVSILATAAAFLPAPASAQTEEQQVQAAEQTENIDTEQTAGAPTSDEIVVTGSRIPRANFDTPHPAVVVGGEQIEQRGYTNLADALEELPAFGVPGSSPVGAANQAGEFGSGQNYVNFFGLGDQRTLTVVNGRRFVSTNTASIFGPTGTNGSQVDFNIFPTLLIDRVETIAVGGAPIYGSDAIAGTINVILKRKFSGIQIDGQYGISERGDAAEYRIRGAVGTNFADGRGNVAVSGEYIEQEGLRYSDRPNHRLNSYFTSPAGDSPFANVYLEDRRLPSIAQYGIPQVSDAFFVLSPPRAGEFGPAFGLPFPLQVGITDNPADPLNGNPLIFDVNGNLVPIDFGEEMGDLVTSNGGNGFELPGSLLAPTRRYLATALANYELTDNIRAFGEAWYANSKGTQFTGQPEYNSYLFGVAGEPGGNLIIDLDNPFLSDQARDIIAANLANNPLTDSPDSFLLGRANVDIISGVASSTVELYRFVGGLDGSFQALGRDMTFEVVGNYGKSTTKGRGRAIVQQNLENAINAVLVDGNIVCAPGYENAPVATISSTCAPLNPFGGQVSQAARDYITTVTDPKAVNDQLMFTASVAGSLFDLPAGEVDFALGYEHRRETAKFDPGAFYTGGPDPDPDTDDNGDGIPDNDRVPFGQSAIMDPISGGFNTDEVFAELKIPVVSRDMNVPMVRSFALNGAFRYIDHSLAGADPTYTLGATWEPVRDITFRGNYTRSVRSPAITEYFNPRSQIFTTADDPCDQRFLAAGPDPSVRQANCVAEGLPGDFSSVIVDRTVAATFAGNTTLTNEIADSWTVGAVLRPSFLPGFTATIDWIDIKVKNAVEGLDATNILNACYDSASYPDVLSSGGTNFCELFERNFSVDPGDPRYGQILSIDTGYQNAAERQFEGLLAEVAYRLETPFLGAESTLNFGLNYLYNHKLDLVIGVGDRTTLRTGIGYSKHQATGNVTYRNDDFSWQWQAQYIGKAKNDPDAPASDYEFPVVDDVIFVNTSLAYDIDRFRFSIVVDNVFDKKQPFPAPAGGGTVTYFDGVMGRYFKFGAGVKF